MPNADEEAKRAYADAGVDVPELKEESKEEPNEEAKPEGEQAPKEEPKDSDAESKDEAHLQDEPKEQRKRSIYEDYKAKKAEAKSEKELREQVEHERDELRAKLEALSKADTPEEKREAADAIDTFAKKINADPAAIREMRDLFLKDAKPASDPELARRLDHFEKWQRDHATVIEQAEFEREFHSSTPKLKTLFPNASPEEMLAIKKELDGLSHTKDWHDKPLAYIAFEHQEKLGALISPKKRGIEGKDRKADVEDDSYEFDPNADYASMTPKQRDQWEAAYKKASRTEGLSVGANGKKILI